MTSTEKKQKSFVLYNDYMEYFALLSLEERGALITAILQYVNAGEHNVTLSGAANMAYHCIRQALDRDRAAYERRCEMNAANGQKGGRPRKNAKNEGAYAPSSLSEKTERFQTEAEKPYTDTDTDSGTDSGADTEDENETDYDSGTDSGTNSGTDSGTDNESHGSAPSLSEDVSDQAPQEKELDIGFLMGRGVPESYIHERRARVHLYAAKNGKEESEVFLEWWQKENLATKRRYGYQPWKSGSASERPPESFSTDAFFADALRRSREKKPS